MYKIFSALWLASAALLAHGAQLDKAIQIEFPERIGNLSFKEARDFGRQELGTSYAYERAGTFLRVNVFVYTAGARALPAGVESVDVRRHFAQVIAEARSLETSGQARSVRLEGASDQVTQYAGCGPQFLWRGFEIDTGAPTPVQSYTYLTAMNGNFVKLRISFAKGATASQHDADQFIAGLRKLLGRCGA